MNRIIRLAAVALVLSPRLALAGMPSVTFSDLGRLRLQTISFFLLGLLVSAAVVMAVWNSLRRDFVWLPRLSYAKACGVVVLWGLLFVVVLTMISGARELMTPGAWQKNGSTYKLAAPATAEIEHPANWLPRYDRLSGPIRTALAAFADRHEDRYPSEKAELTDGVSNWNLVDLPGTTYILVPGRQRGGPPAPLVYEPEVYDGKHFVLLTDGTIRELPFAEILRLVETT